MATRTKRARMLYKLVYLLGPEQEEYRKEEGEKPYTFTTALNQTLAIFDDKYHKAKEQLIKDYANLKEKISDDDL